MTLVVFQHVDFLCKLAVTLLTLVLLNALVELHVVPQGVFRLHTCSHTRTHTHINVDGVCTTAAAHRGMSIYYPTLTASYFMIHFICTRLENKD